MRLHLPEKLARKSVGALLAIDLRDLRDSLAVKMLPASVNRTMTAFRAALNLATETDERIANRRAWKDGLKALPDAGEARNVILNEHQVRAIIAAAYKHCEELGLFVEVAAATGARPSQLSRLRSEDVQLTDKPRLMMPASRKGRGKRKVAHQPVPISLELAQRLAGRKGILFQLLHEDGTPWGERERSRRFAKAVKTAGFDPTEITPYALRHSSIVRQLLANVPVRVVAALHDTSVAMIERTYSKHIADHSDNLARAALLKTSAEILPLRAKEVPA